MKTNAAIVLFLLLPVFSRGQDPGLPEELMSVAEELASNEDALPDFIERLHELNENPVNINSGSDEEISRLFFLSDFQVKALADYIRSTGRIVSAYEIMNIPGFDRQTVTMLMPLISLGAGTQAGDTIKPAHTILSNFSIRSVQDSAAPGSPWKILTKYKLNLGRITSGITIEKDNGETFLSGVPASPDFISAYLSYAGSGILKKIIAGDYSARFGPGIHVNTGMRTALSLTSAGCMSAADVLKPYTSTDENNYFRGIAAQLSYKKAGAILFLSGNRTDASTEPGGEEGFRIRSLNRQGLHTSPSLLKGKDAVLEKTFGLGASYDFRSLRTGISFSRTEFSLPFGKDASPESVPDFEGDKTSVLSAYYSRMFKNSLIYGEFSLTDRSRHAALQGISLRPSGRLTINAFMRAYQPGYTAFHGRGPGAGTYTENEQGVFCNAAFEAAKYLFISAGTDVYRFPWLRYRCSSPSNGYKREVRIKYLPRDRFSAELVYAERVTMYDETEDSGIPALAPVETHTVRGVFRYELSERISLVSRLDHKISGSAGNKGYLILQDVILKPDKLPLTFWFRYCLFDTDGWDARLYAYENDLLYSFSIPALSGKGSRSYAMLKYDAGKHAEFRIKYGFTNHTDTGDEEGTCELRLQARLFF